ncbi:hypothetical protein H261_07828 [Paramagnetospirillum caucaseum]|uniref:Uncharacterized protein n=1 Tax=Paramagnetospirillum caucaseum TaxID=1244869 RepID=M2ZT37_9PROT|nr:hypothetical protein [Paramagnetospirillum caucaseum]EME70522.1 hypothetical protein H261_07828 [Paramagnetospirillum caucaseum]
MSNPYDHIDSETMLADKDRLVLTLARRLAKLGLKPDYAIRVIEAARGVEAVERIAVLEGLVEIEALKYALAARRVRELEAGEDE